MRSKIPSLLLAPALMAAAALATHPALAESRLDVPFSFTVAGQNCPAGSYVVDRNPVGGLVTLRSLDAPRSFAWALGPGDPAPTDTRVVLRFDDFGQSRALQSVQFGGLITSRLDRKPKDSEHVLGRVVTGR